MKAIFRTSRLIPFEKVKTDENLSLHLIYILLILISKVNFVNVQFENLDLIPCRNRNEGNISYF